MKENWDETSSENDSLKTENSEFDLNRKTEPEDAETPAASEKRQKYLEEKSQYPSNSDIPFS